MNRIDAAAFVASEVSTGEGLKLLGVLVFLVLLMVVPGIILFLDERRSRNSTDEVSVPRSGDQESVRRRQ